MVACDHTFSSQLVGRAWESNGHGAFTVALLELLKDSRMDKLCYCNIIMCMYIDPKYVYNLSVKICHTDTLFLAKAPIAKG